jgi:hypothetical protein
MNSLPLRGVHAAVIAAALLAAIVLAVYAVSIRVAHRASFDPAALSSPERAQLSELVLTVTEEPQEAMAEARNRVWAIVRPYGARPAEARRSLEPIFLKIGQGPRLFWADARRALAERQPVKSEARTQWEAELMGEGWLTMAQQHRYDDFMQRIARGEPIESSHGVEVALDDKMIRAINDSLDDGELRKTVAELLTPP